jgi:hypothetical protein
MLIQPDAGGGLGQHARKRGFADLKRIAPQVVAVQLDEVEGIEKYAPISALVPDEIERGNAVLVASNRLAIDDAGARARAGEGFLLVMGPDYESVCVISATPRTF